MDKRVFVKKKNGYLVESESLLSELKENLKEDKLRRLEIYNIYDVFNIEDEEYSLLKNNILSEVVTDTVVEELNLNEKKYLAMEFLPGQYDQRGDSAQQCLALLGGREGIQIKSGRVIIFYGKINSLEKIKRYLINPIEAREKNMNVLSFDENTEIEGTKRFERFNEYTKKELEEFLEEKGLALNIADLLHIQNYFKREEKRVPTETEIKVLDTYWSDHCRHTTFETYLESLRINDGALKKKLEEALAKYLDLRKELRREDKPVTLMDMATIGARYIKSIGGLKDLEISEENNACSIEIDIDVNGKNEKYLLMFKNETHNHPTEIEPFGGASTCIGGAIRDPLSGRAYVYQAMRITGAGDITESLEETLENKLPQKIISKTAAHGYASYGNQIGLATTYIKEIYHQGYKAKRMEVGAVVAAVKKEYVRRETPTVGDLVVVIGGRTGRDGVGGATGSSKEHNNSSLEKCSSEVQKGNAPIERKIQRLFRNPKVTKLIKKANDFGAGGVSVAIGEIAPGVEIDLDKILVKYNGLSGTDLAISESQERMAVVIESKDKDKFMEYLKEENLEGSIPAIITNNNRLVIKFKGEKIVDLNREFLDTNGVRAIQKVEIDSKIEEIKTPEFNEKNFSAMLTSLNVASQKGMMEMFDYSIGRGTVLIPYGGEKQLTQEEASVEKIATEGLTNSCSILAYGYNPFISESSPYLGGSYSVIESLCKVVAVGGDFRKSRLSFQEYFEKLGNNSEKWGKPTAALLGALEAQIEFGTPAIGGKDSMSGTFNNIHVPPTLISFAVAVEKSENIIAKEFNDKSKFAYLIYHKKNQDSTPNYEKLKENMMFVKEGIDSKLINAVGVVTFGGWGETIAKMALGEMKYGGEFNSIINPLEMCIGSFVVATDKKLIENESIKFLGEIKESKTVTINNINTSHSQIKNKIEEKFEKIYPYFSKEWKELPKKLLNPEKKLEGKASIFKGKKAKVLYENPKVLIGVFPGTNSEYDTERAFKVAGGTTEFFIFNNLSKTDIENSIENFAKKISETQILVIPGGFSAGDEPDGSGKFIANILQNKKINMAIKELLKRQGLILGICNGFQALIKSGLLPYGDTEKLNRKSPTLFRNDINRHISHMCNTKITSNSTPWLSSFKIGDIHRLPISHGEGKIVVSEEKYLDLLRNGQIVTRYCNENGEVRMDSKINRNGSYYAIEGLISPCGQILGKMAHSERYEEGVFKNINGEKLQDIFKNGVDFFKK